MFLGLELAGEGLVHGPAHSSIGQEGGAVGSIVGLRTTDAVNGSHRGHHQFLAKAIAREAEDENETTEAKVGFLHAGHISLEQSSRLQFEQLTGRFDRVEKQVSELSLRFGEGKGGCP